MNFEVLLSEPQEIRYHAIAAIIAIAIGAMQFILPKGTRWHKGAGYIWCLMMYIVSLTGFFIHKIQLIGPFSPIHLLSVVTIISVTIGIRAARSGDIETHQRTMIYTYIFALGVAGAFTLLPGRVMHQVIFG